MAPGWVEVHSIRPLVPMVRLVRMELPLFGWWSIGEKHIIITTWISLMALGRVGVHSTRPLVPMVRLVPMGLYLFDWWCIGEMHIIISRSLMAQGWVRVHSICPLVPMVRLVPMKLALFDWCCIREIHIIMKTYNIFDGSRLSRDVFYWSVGANGTIGTNGIPFIRLVIPWWKAYHYNELCIFDRGRRVSYEK